MRTYAGVLFAAAVLGAVACGGGKPAKGDLTVSGSPTGEVEGKVRFVLAFNRPMVGKDAFDKPLATPPLTITPQLATDVRWADDKTLVVVPTTTLPLSTKYTISLPGSTKALDGSVLGQAATFEIFTERLAGTIEVLGSTERATKDQVLKIAFNHEVAFDQIAARCAINGKTGSIRLELAKDSSAGPAKSYTVQPVSDLALDSEWTATCAAGLAGTVGNLGIEKPLEQKFKTYGPLHYVSMEPSGNDIVPDENLQLKLAFSNPLAEPYQLKIEPKVVGFPQRCHSLGDAPVGVACGGLFEARTDYTLTIGKDQKDIFGQALGAPQTVTFHTSDAQPTISLESGYFVAELKRPVVPLWTRNVTQVEVTAVKLEQTNYHQLAPLINWWESTPIDFAKTKLKPITKKIAIAGKKNEWGQHSIDPAELFGGTAGPGMYYLELASDEVGRGPYTDGGRQKILANFTDIGVVTKIAGSRGLVWATKLSTGKPLPGATVTVRDGQGKQTFTGTTDADGVAVLPGLDVLSGTRKPKPEHEYDEEYGGDLRVYVSLGDDWTMVAPERSSGLAAWNFNVSQDYSKTAAKLRGYMHTDRGLYRPGDKVHVKGLARIAKLGESLQPASPGKKVAVEVTGPQGKTFVTTQARVSPFGGFWFDLDLPADARLGDYSIRATLDAGTFYRTFAVEEYKPATFEVTGKATTQWVVSRGNVDATINASYFYGAPVRSAPVDVTVHSRQRQVDFEQYEGYQFYDERRYSYSYYNEDTESQQLVGEEQFQTDDKGNAKLKLAVSPNDVYADSDLLVRASVTAPSNEVISKTFVVPYYHSKRYFGIKAEDWFLDVKKPAKFKLIGVAPDGKPLDGPAKVTVTRRDWNCVWEDWGYNGSYHCDDKQQTIVDKVVQITGGQPVDIEFTPDTGGDYLLVVEGENAKAEAAPAALQLFAWGDGGGSWRSDDSLKFDIVSDKKEYKAGDTATLALKTDLAQATGLVTIERDGVIEKRLVDITPTTKHITVPITEAMAPNVYVSVALVQGRTGDGNRGKPRMRMGVINLPVRPQDNRLTVTIEPDKKDYRPGENVTATVKVTDATGAPVSAEVSITAADEGVLSLVAYETPDPIPTFYAPWGLGVQTATQYEYIRDIPAPNVERPATGGDAAGTLRSRFVATAVWVPGAVTDASGIATVKFAAPDNLTAFRLMAVAADKGYRFGSGDKRFTVSKPLQLLTSLPRFLSVGDEATAGVVVHNETGAAGTATVKVSADGVSINGPTEQTIQLGKGARVPVLFGMSAAAPGEATLKFTVSMGKERDGLEVKLPVQHPSAIVTDHRANASTKDAAKIAVSIPPDAIPGTAEVMISVDPDGLSGIEEGLSDLVEYPYGCLEQTTSKVIPMLAVRDLAESLQLDGLSGDRLDGFVKDGLAKIGRHQTPYGGFSLWPGGEPSAYYTAYALWGLYLAKQAGYKVDKTRIEEGLEYLRNDGANPDTSHEWYDESGNLGSQAFALYVRTMLGDKGAATGATALATNPKLPVYGKAYVARTLAASLGVKDPAVQKLLGELTALADKAARTETLIGEASKYAWYMSSNLRTTAMVLGALVDLDPKNAAIRGLVRAIMKNRHHKRYVSTQENLYTLLALSGYAKTQAGNTPAVTVNLAGTDVITGTLSGKGRLRVARVPLAANGEVAITPTGEVTYNVDLRYRKKPAALQPEATGGLALTREYLDEAGKPKTTFTVGDIVVVRVTTSMSSSYADVMLSDPIPAGFEALNARLVTVGAATKQSEDWGTYREMKDDRVNFTSEWWWRGRDTYEYSMRATTAGKFARPPTSFEQMYEPENHATTAFETIEVKAK
jgi:uncharacterized protein YfaS (alpha-2-macroglobulin family)